MKTTIKTFIVTLVAIVAVVGFSSYTNVEASAQLTEKTLPAAMIESISNYETSAEFQYVGDTKKLNAVISGAINQLRQQDPYTHLNLSKWQASYKGTTKEVTITFKFTYLTDAAKEAYVDEQVKKLTASIIKGAKTDYDKVKAIHDYIVLNATYNKNTKSSQHIAYTMLTEKKGVCQSYATLAYRLLTEAGIDTKIAIGHAKKELHSWNMVKVGGKWYHMDVTFDDPINNKSNLINYDFFLTTDAQMKKTHQWEKNSIPVATSKTYAVYNQVKQAVSVGNELHFYDAKLKKYRVLNTKTLKFSNSNATKYKNALKKAKK